MAPKKIVISIGCTYCALCSFSFIALSDKFIDE